MFYAIKILGPKLSIFSWVIAFALWPFLAIFKMHPFSNFSFFL